MLGEGMCGCILFGNHHDLDITSKPISFFSINAALVITTVAVM